MAYPVQATDLSAWRLHCARNRRLRVAIRRLCGRISRRDAIGTIRVCIYCILPGGQTGRSVLCLRREPASEECVPEARYLYRRRESGRPAQWLGVQSR